MIKKDPIGTEQKREADRPNTGLGALRQIPYMGVIYVVAEAMKL